MKHRIQTAKLAVLCSALLALGACSKDPISKAGTNNPEITVELLFEKDGVKVYRFTDSGRSIYYTDARGRTDWSVNQGKNGVRHFGVETAQ
jgi:hypothetical protein